jgi:hypothetical protein
MHPSFALLRLKISLFFISYYLSALKAALHLHRWAKINKAIARQRQRSSAWKASAVRDGS